jgi:hypothetical protein
MIKIDAKLELELKKKNTEIARQKAEELKGAAKDGNKQRFTTTTVVSAADIIQE